MVSSYRKFISSFCLAVTFIDLVVDFAIFGALADVIGAELFPVDTASKQLLKGLGKNVLFASKQQDTTITHI